MKKSLQSIAKAEQLGGGKGGTLSPDFLEEIHLSSRGDLRHAIFAMQFRCSYSTTKSSGRMNSSNENNSSKKDAKLSTFHALGKLLYAKRKQQQHQSGLNYDSEDDLATTKPSSAAATALINSKWNDGRGQLDFVPEDVFNRIDMGIGSAITFLSYHSPDFFTDATDLSRSFDLMSDAVTFLDRFGQTDGPFPTEYASCIGGRAVADGNRHPAPPQFRQFSAPKVFNVMKKNRENESKIGHLRKRLSMGSANGQKTSLHDNIGSAHQFVTDSLPYMRTVAPQDVNHALSNLHSYAKDSSGTVSNEPQQALEEENNVLLEDELVDDGDW